MKEQNKGIDGGRVNQESIDDAYAAGAYMDVSHTNEECKDNDDFPTGEIRYTMCNDYMFKAVLQKNERALKGLVAALLFMEYGDIDKIEIRNPIELGKALDDKTCILDIKLLLNDDTLLNIEIQVAKFEDWTERSLTYLCRVFDQLSAGQDYGDILPTYHIGILDFWLPGKKHEFYAEYRMMNTKNNEIYSDKLGINVLNLKAVDDDIIVKEPKELYDWAKLFKATTWEEIKMLAQGNPHIADTVVTLRQLTEDEQIQMQCEARERYDHNKASWIKQGKREGMEEGKLKMLLGLIIRKLAKGRSLSEIAEDLEEEPEAIRLLYETAKRFAPDCDVDMIYEAYKEEKIMKVGG